MVMEPFLQLKHVISRLKNRNFDRDNNIDDQEYNEKKSESAEDSILRRSFFTSAFLSNFDFSDHALEDDKHLTGLEAEHELTDLHYAGFSNLKFSDHALDDGRHHTCLEGEGEHMEAPPSHAVANDENSASDERDGGDGNDQQRQQQQQETTYAASPSPPQVDPPSMMNPQLSSGYSAGGTSRASHSPQVSYKSESDILGNNSPIDDNEKGTVLFTFFSKCVEY
ncbi:hypothetical protein ACFE04_021149 [Oxalis oulophora]